MNIVAVSKAIRLPFLVLTPACVFLGFSVVVANEFEVHLHLLVLTLLGAVLAHVGVNALNEYADFRSGLDLTTSRTPFSGGSGALPEHPDTASAVLAVGVASVVGMLLIGVFFVWKFGMAVLPIGLLGLLLVVAYTPWITRRPFMCLVSPGLGFGFLMVVGTHFAMTGEYSTLSWQVGIVPFFLINNLLLLNQYPDLHADRAAGRNHLLIAYGVKTGNAVYGGFLILAIAAIVFSVLHGTLPLLSLIALLPTPLAFFALNGALKYGETIGNYPGYLAANVVVAVFTPVLLGVSLLVGGH